MMVSAVMCSVYLLHQILHLFTVTFLHLLQKLQSCLQVLHQLPFHVHITLHMACPKNIIKVNTQIWYTAHIRFKHRYALTLHNSKITENTDTNRDRHIHSHRHSWQAHCPHAVHRTRQLIMTTKYTGMLFGWGVCVCVCAYVILNGIHIRTSDLVGIATLSVTG